MRQIRPALPDFPSTRMETRENPGAATTPGQHTIPGNETTADQID